MRHALVLTLALTAIAATGCGNDSGGGVAGTYVLDASEMMNAMKEMMAPMLEGLPPEARAEAEKEMAKNSENAKLDVEIRGDGTFTVSSNMGGEQETTTGTWTQDGETLTFVATHEDGKEKDEPDTIKGRYADGTITLIPEEGEDMPFEMVLRKK